MALGGGDSAQLAILLSLKDEASRKFKEAGASAQTFGNTLKAVGTIAAGFMAGNVIGKGLEEFQGFVGGSVKAASSLGESVNAVQQIFEGSSATVLAWGKDSAEAFGLSQRAFNQLATPLGASLKNLGFGVEEAGEKTIALTKRAADMASVFDTEVADALGAINSALRGEADPIERFGVSVNQTAVNLRALGMTGKTSAAQLTEHEKAVARLGLIFEQTNAVAGDFEATSNGLANSQRRAAARVENLQQQIGQYLLPVVLKITQAKLAFAKVLADRVLPALEGVGRWVSSVAGPFERWAPIVAGVAAVIGGAFVGALVAAGVAAWGLATPLLALAAPFIAIGAAIGIAVAALVFVIQKFDSLPAPVQAVIGVVRALAIGLVALSALAIAPLILAVRGVIDAFQNWDQITGFVGSVFGAISNKLAEFVNWLGNIWGAVLPILVAPFEGMIEPVKGAMRAVIQIVQSALNGIGQQLSRLGNLEIGGVKPFAKLGEFGAALTAKVGDAFAGIDATFDGIASAVNGGVARVGGAFQGLGDAVRGIVPPLDRGRDELDKFAGAAGAAVNKLGEAIQRLEEELISRQVQAFFKGGIDAVNAVRNMQVGIREQITKLAAQLMQVFGFDLPTALGFAMDEVLKKADEVPKAARRVMMLARATQPVLNPASIPWGEEGKKALQFAQGGIVPGPLGVPVPAIVHGGERIFRADQHAGGDVFNIKVEVHGSLHSDRTLEDAIGRGLLNLRRRNVQV